MNKLTTLSPTYPFSSSSVSPSSFTTLLTSCQKKWQKRNKKSSIFSVTSAISIATILVIVITIVPLPSHQAHAFNDEKGILKWNPYWFSNFRYSAPSSFYISPNRAGTPFKRISEPTGTSGINGHYKWSPVYFSSGSSGYQQPSSYFGMDGGYMYSPNRPRWSLTDHFGGGGGLGGIGGSRYLTRYYGGNSFIPQPIHQRSVAPVASVVEPSVIDLAGSNDLSALLGEEMMNNGLGLENLDKVDILDGNDDDDAPATQQQQQLKSH